MVKTRVPINSIALCPLHPHLFATGGGDAIGMRNHLPLASMSALADVLASVRCSARYPCFRNYSGDQRWDAQSAYGNCVAWAVTELCKTSSNAEAVSGLRCEAGVLRNAAVQRMIALEEQLHERQSEDGRG